MRIGYLVPEFPNQTHTFFWREIQALRELGHQVDILSTRRPPADACRHSFAAEARRETHYLWPPRATSVVRAPKMVRLATLRYAAQLNGRSPRELANYVALSASALDLLGVARHRAIEHVHVHSAANATHVAALCRAFGGPPYSLTLHGDLEVYGSDHQAKAKSAEFVATVTRPLQQQVINQLGLPKAKVPVIWMGVDTDKFAPKPNGRGGTPIRLATIARLNRAKGHAFALRAIQRCRNAGLDLRYTIAGQGDYRSAIEEEVRNLGLQDVVDLPGTVAEGEVLRLLQQSHGFVLPSFGLGEAAPVSVMEAMSAGCAVVCSRIGGTTDMITDGVDGFLVEQQDVDGLERAFTKIAKGGGEVDAIRRQARERAKQAFDFKVMAARLARAMMGDPEGASLKFGDANGG